MADSYIDASEMERFAKKLAALPKQALPNAVRNTLNDMAFDVKTKTLPESGEKNFTNRSKTFFKANSAFTKATGFNMDTMHSIVGMSSDRLKNMANNYAVKDMESQEHGGIISHKSFIPLDNARIGGSQKRNVRNESRVQDLRTKKFTSINRNSAKSKKQQFIRAAIYAKTKEDGLVLGHRTKSGGRALIRIDIVQQNIKSGKLRIKFKSIYNIKKGRQIKVKPTHFMKEAAEKTVKKIPEIWKKAAEFQFKKHLRL